MELFASFLLGLVQAITEFLPVSSSGHLVVFHHLLDLHEGSVAFDAILHLGTAAATLCFYRKQVIRIVVGTLRWLSERFGSSGPVSEEAAWSGDMSIKIVLCCFVTAALALPLEDFFESLFANPAAVGIAFLATGCLLLATKKWQVGAETEGLTHITYKMALIVGLTQFLAVTPGISRSGITIATGLLLGLNRSKAAEFSFLISIPIILGAGTLQLLKAGSAIGLAQLLIGVGTSFFGGLAALFLLIYLIRRGAFYMFSYYLFPLGILVLIAAAFGVL